MEQATLAHLLSSNPYPGRGIVLGRSADDKCAILAYFIMGRSENSRNRIFAATPDGIRTQAHDPSKMTDPSLIIYAPVRMFGGKTIVTNGDQTDTVREALAAGGSFYSALHTRAFEPDAPNYTPRISGLVEADGSYTLSLLKSLAGDPACCQRCFFSYDHPVAGVGHFVHTYEHDGTPLPSFAGEPRAVVLDAPTPAAFAELLWSSLNPDNKVSLFVRYITLADGSTQDVICNKHA